MKIEVGSKIYFLRTKDDIRSGVVIKSTKTRLTVETDDGEIKTVLTGSAHNTLEKAIKASKSATKVAGKSTEVYPFWELDDIKKMLDGFERKGWYHWRTAFMIGLLTGRRCGDVLSMKWSDFFDGGKPKRTLDIIEEKTGKSTSLHIPPLLFATLSEYAEKSGNSMLTMSDSDLFPSKSARKYEAYRKAFKKVADEVGIEYPVSTHSVRKTFGLWSRRLHPQDINSMQILQRFFNHSDVATTSHYIGLDAEAEKRYIEDMSNLIKRVSDGDTSFIVDNRPVLSLHSDDLRRLLQNAYIMGRNNADNDVETQLENMNDLYAMAESKAIGQDVL